MVAIQDRLLSHKPSVLAIIPARAGSKGIPGKNMIDVGGRPMIEWTFIAAQESAMISAIEVSTDDLSVVEIARHRGLTVPRTRPPELADDSTSMNDVVHDVIDHSIHEAFDFLILLQPTSPLRTAAHIDQAMSELLDSGRQSLVSVTPSREKVYWSYTINDQETLQPLFPEALSIRSRHDLPATFALNGAIYICRTDLFRVTHELVHHDSFPFLMDQESAVDVDSPIDLELARSLMTTRQKA